MMFSKVIIYSHGVWKLKKGQGNNFVQLYKEFAKYAKKHYGLLEAELLVDVSDDKTYVSYGLWQKINDVKTWTKSREFDEYMSKFSVICSSIKINIIKPLENIKH